MPQLRVTRLLAFLARYLFISLLPVVLLSCRPAERRYAMTGEVIGGDRSARQLIVRNDDIPGYMESMTMPFAVKDPTALDRLQSGQRIRATLVVTKSNSWLEDIQVTGQAPADAGAPHSELQIPVEGTPVPDFAFTNQDGRAVHLAQYRGKVVLLTFIYTRCPMPDFCPRMTNNFVEIEKSLKKDANVYARTHLLSITFDPAFDTPRVLRHYALSTTSLAATDLFPHWEFLAPKQNDLDSMAKFFAVSLWQDNGAKFSGEKTDGPITHSLSTAILDGNGKLYRWYHGNDWTTDEMLRQLQTAIATN